MSYKKWGRWPFSCKEECPLLYTSSIFQIIVFSYNSQIPLGNKLCFFSFTLSLVQNVTKLKIVQRTAWKPAKNQKSICYLKRHFFLFILKCSHKTCINFKLLTWERNVIKCFANALLSLWLQLQLKNAINSVTYTLWRMSFKLRQLIG